MAELFRALGRHASANGSKVAFTDDRASITWSELAARVAAFSDELQPSPPVLGLFGHNEIDWVIGALAAWLAGKTVVPLPTQFSTAQLRHVLADAGISEIIATPGAIEACVSLGCDVRPVSQHSSNQFPEPAKGAGMIVYTSGSTGTPKGVRLGLDQLDRQAESLAGLVGASARDVHLSVLPLPLLLETICAVGVPIQAGACSHLATQAARDVAEGRLPALGELLGQHATTATVLVPQLLTAWVAQMEASGEQAPAGLRFVAVGGAPISPLLAERAWRLGVPVHEGYGLTECCSVVAVNTPGCRMPGTVGLPLPGLDVRIEEGEIVVEGATVMNGYLNGEDTGACWHTGDLGHLDDDGFLTVTGRKDNLIVTSFGRNVSPEWIEAMLLADARILACAVFGHGTPNLSVFLVPSAAGEIWLSRTPRAQIQLWIERVCVEAPRYAVPKDFTYCTADKAQQRGLLTANGQVVRSAAERVCNALRQPAPLAVV